MRCRCIPAVQRRFNVYIYIDGHYDERKSTSWGMVQIARGMDYKVSCGAEGIWYKLPAYKIFRVYLVIHLACLNKRLKKQKTWVKNQRKDEE